MRGAELRVRPVVMTSLTAALGLLPAALANSIGSQAQKPLAIVVVGGMLVTLFLTRYLMPVLYSFFPAPAGHTECGDGADRRLALHRPVLRSPGRTATSKSAGDEPGLRAATRRATSIDPATGSRRKRIMKTRLEDRPGPRAVAGGDRRLAGRRPPDAGAAVAAAWSQLSGSAAHASEARPSKDWIESPGGGPGSAPGRRRSSLGPSRSRRSA